MDTLVPKEKIEKRETEFTYESLDIRHRSLFSKIETLWPDFSNDEHLQIIQVVFKNSPEDGLTLGEKLRFTSNEYWMGILQPRFVYAHQDLQLK